MMKIKETVKGGTVIKLRKEPAEIRRYDAKKDKEVVEKDIRQGQINWRQNDVIGLRALLSRFDTKNTNREMWKVWERLEEKIYRVYVNDKRKIKLTDSEVGFLRGHLESLEKKARDEKSNIRLRGQEIRTITHVLSQLD